MSFHLFMILLLIITLFDVNNIFFFFFASVPSFLYKDIYIGPCRQKKFFKYLHLLRRHSSNSRIDSFLQEPNRAGKLSVAIGPNKSFQNSQTFFTRDGKHCEE